MKQNYLAINIFSPSVPNVPANKKDKSLLQRFPRIIEVASVEWPICFVSFVERLNMASTSTLLFMLPVGQKLFEELQYTLCVCIILDM